MNTTILYAIPVEPLYPVLRVPSFNWTLVYILISFLLTLLPFIPRERRIWVLSSVMTPLFSVIGIVQMIYWAMSMDTNDSNGVRYIAEMFKAYFFVDLLHNGIWHFREVGLLDFWLHHIVYIFLIDTMKNAGCTGYIRPFMLLEVPTAIRALGGIYPGWHTKRGFVGTFVVFRIIWPFIAISKMAMPEWLLISVLVIQVGHVYWGYRYL